MSFSTASCVSFVFIIFLVASVVVCVCFVCYSLVYRYINCKLIIDLKWLPLILHGTVHAKMITRIYI